MKAPSPPGGADIALAGLTGGVGLLVLASNLPVAVAVSALVISLVQAAALLLRPTSIQWSAGLLAVTLPAGILLHGVPGLVAWPALAFLAGRHGGAAVVALAYLAAVVACGLVAPAAGAPVGEIVLEAAVIVGLLPSLAFALGRWRRAVRGRDRARQDAQEASRLAAALVAERGRIADDLGDVVLGELRRVAELAAGLRTAVEAGPAEAPLAELQQAARRALTAMRRVLTVLRSADTDLAPVATAPPRRWWEPGRPEGSGLVLASVLAVLMLVTGLAHDALRGGTPFDVLDLPVDRPALFAVLGAQVAATAWWRSGPVPALAVATVASFTLNLLDASQYVGEAGWMILVYAAGSWASPRVSAVAVLASSAVVALEFTMLPHSLDQPPAQIALESLSVAALWGLGLTVRAIRLRSGRARAAAAEGRLRTSLGDERHRIARELHDLVAHHCSAVAVQASAARAAPVTLPEALDHIEESGRRIADAARELAELAPPAAVPPLTRETVERMAAGLPVTVDVEGEAPAETGEADLFAHRILGEAITNVLRHAGPSPTHVLVRHTPGAVDLEIGDAGPVPGHRPTTAGSGLGLVGMRERAALLGGEATAGPGEDGWWVKAHLPRAAPPRASGSTPTASWWQEAV